MRSTSEPTGSRSAPARGTGGGWPSEPPPTDAAAHDREPDPREIARTIALRMLDGAPRSRSQLATAMARRGVPDDAATAVLDRFAEVGLVDDDAYAAAFVRSRHAGSGQTGVALREQLRRRGVDDAAAERAMAQIGHQDDEAVARRLVVRKLAATRGLDRDTRVRRTLAALGRKGHSPALVMRLVRDELAVEADGAAAPDPLAPDAATPDGPEEWYPHG